MFCLTSFRRLHPSLLLALLLALAGTVQAQDDKRSAQLREAAKRAQAAAQQAQQELAGMRAERDKLAAAEAQRATQLSQVQSQERSRAAQAQALKAQLSGAEAEHVRLKTELASLQAERDALTKRLEQLQSEGQASSQALAEQRQLTQNVVGLLSQSLKSLAAAEDTNRKLQALGLQAVAAYETLTPQAMRAREISLSGIDAVRLGDDAEKLRQAMGALKLVP